MTARLLVVSNGNGEDDIACKVIDALRATARAPQIEAWPMVGNGRAYLDRGVPVVGVQNTLPSEGFGTLSLKLFARDLKAGFIGTHLAQARFARAPATHTTRSSHNLLRPIHRRSASRVSRWNV